MTQIDCVKIFNFLESFVPQLKINAGDNPANKINIILFKDTFRMLATSQPKMPAVNNSINQSIKH